MTRLTVMVGLLWLNGLAVAQNCNEIEDDKERLACYDARNASPVSDPMRAQSVPPSEPPTSDRVPEPVDEPRIMEAEAPEEFGKKEPVEKAREYIEGIIVEIKEVANVTYIRLDNGQVWRETKEGNLRFKEGRNVKITEGILNSYDLTMEGSSQVVKVKRVR